MINTVEDIATYLLAHEDSLDTNGIELSVFGNDNTEAATSFVNSANSGQTDTRNGNNEACVVAFVQDARGNRSVRRYYMEQETFQELEHDERVSSA